MHDMLLMGMVQSITYLLQDDVCLIPGQHALLIEHFA